MTNKNRCDKLKLIERGDIVSAETYYFYSMIVSVLMAFLTLAGLIFACVQLWQIKKNRVRQFDQARREKTVEMVLRYTKDTDNLTRAVEKIVAQFSDEQCQDLYNGIPFEIDDKTRQRLCGVCPHQECCKKLEDGAAKYCQSDDGKCSISGDLLYFVRGSIINYLNSLECVLLSWQLGIVDQFALEEQFAFLDKKRSTDRAAMAFRTFAGNGKSYPAIEKFYQHLDQQRMESAKKSLKDILE